MRLRRITVKGFRSLKDVSLLLEPLTVMIGPNSAGKSALLRVLQLAKKTADGHLAAAVSAEGTLQDILTRDETFKLILSLEGSEENKTRRRSSEPLCWTIDVEPVRIGGYRIVSEALTQSQKPGKDPFRFIDRKDGRVLYHDPQQNKLVAPDWPFDEAESALGQARRTYAGPEKFRAFLASLAAFHQLDVSEKAPIRLPQKLQPVDLPGPNGEDLISFLHQIEASGGDSYSRITDILKAAFPAFRKLSFPIVGAGQATLTWTEEPFRRAFYASDLSEGTLRFLWLTSLLMAPKLPPIVLIDEPEVSLHPDLIRILAELLQEASLRSHVLVATHSDLLIRWLKPNEVVVVEREEGYSAFRRGSEMNLDRWLQKYTLDQLWLMGEIGGRP